MPLIHLYMKRSSLLPFSLFEYLVWQIAFDLLNGFVITSSFFFYQILSFDLTIVSNLAFLYFYLFLRSLDFHVRLLLILSLNNWIPVQITNSFKFTFSSLVLRHSATRLSTLASRSSLPLAASANFIFLVWSNHQANTKTELLLTAVVSRRSHLCYTDFFNIAFPLTPPKPWSFGRALSH